MDDDKHEMGWKGWTAVWAVIAFLLFMFWLTDSKVWLWPIKILTTP